MSGALILLAIFLLVPITLYAHDSDQDQASDYVEVFDGDMPLVFAVGHGGWKELGDEKNGGYSADPLLRDYFYRVLAVRIYERTGHLPYVVYQQGNRNYVNTNREVDSSEAYHPNNTQARDAYFEFHNQVDAMIGRIEANHGADSALMINAHTTDLSADRVNRPWDRIADIGFIASVTDLGSSSNTMKSLYDRKGEAALRGEDSIPYRWFHGQGWPTPDAVWPEAATSNSKTLAKAGQDVWHVLPAWVAGYNTDNWSTAFFNGSKVILYHGTNTWGHHENWSNGLDAFQLEVNYTKHSGIGLHKTDPGYDSDGPYYQLDVPFTTALMDDLIDAILHSLRVNYNWVPGGVYNVIVDNGGAGFSTTGSWSESIAQGFWDTPSIYSDEAGATATWMPNLVQPGTYEVLIRWTDVGDRVDDARYTVNHADGAQTFVINQGAGQDAKWVSLGQFRFGSGRSGSVVLESTGGGLATAADAVLFRLVYEDSGIIVDNLDAGFATVGEWEESQAFGEYAGSSICAASDGATATWTPNLPEQGTYAVLVRWCYWSTRAEHAPYTIVHANGSDVVRVDQHERAGQWAALGIYEFNAGTAGSVTLTREAGDGVTSSADAVKFVKIVSNSYLPAIFKGG